MGKLIILFKDKSIDASQFEHLADITVHNQYVPAPNDLTKCIEFEANEDEMNRMSWFSVFSGRDILYILDRHEDVRERLVKSRNTSGVGGSLKLADIVLVQLGERIFCIKNKSGMKDVLRFACANTIPEELDHISNITEIRAEAKEMLRSLVRSKGAECEYCGYSEDVKSMDIYLNTGTEEVCDVSIIRYGALRDFDEVYEESQEGTVLCMNCAVSCGAIIINCENY